MDSFPRQADWSLGEAQRKRWAQFDFGLLQGYLDAAEKVGGTTPIGQ